MGNLFETLTGKEIVLDNQKIYTLSLESDKGDAKAKTAAVGEEDNERVSKAELERAYRADSFIFNAVNVSAEMIMSAGYEIVAKKAAVRKFFENFLENLSKVGADATWEEILERIFQDAYIYGGSWNELVWNTLDTKPVDLKTLNAKEMDFARDEKGNVLLDDYEKPIGYVQTLPYGTEKEGKGDEAPEIVSLKDNQIFILPKRICYIPLYTFGAGFEGIGRVEPGYKATIWKLNLLKAGAESTSRRGFSPVIAKVGNENVHPTPQMIQNILEKLKTLDYSKYMAIPNYVELTTLDVKSIDTYEGFLQYLTAMQSAALGVPVPFVTGLGEACYSEDTLTLTDKGLKYYWEVSEEDKIATVNPENGNIEYHKPTDIRVYDFDGEMHHYKSSNVDILVTPEHEIYHCGVHSKEWRKSKSKDIKINSFKFKNNVEFEGEEQEKIIIPEIEYDSQSRMKNIGNQEYKMDDWLEFIGYYVSEGWCSIDKGSYVIELSQVKEDVINKMISCLERMGLNPNIKRGHGRVEGLRFSNKSLAIYLHTYFGDISQNKGFPKEYLNLSKRQLTILFNSMILGDGSEFGTTGLCYYTSSEKLFNQTIEIMLKIGYTVSYNDYRKKHSIWRISGNKTRIETNVRKSKNFNLENYKGKVYCFEVPNHLFITFRNGKIAIQGNTNRSTLSTQLQVYELSLNTVANKICRSIEKYVFKPISIANGFDEVPRLEWGRVSTIPEKLKTQIDEDSKKEEKDKEKDEEEDSEEDKKDYEKKKKLDLTDSTISRGNPMNTSYQTQGISIKKSKKRKKR